MGYCTVPCCTVPYCAVPCCGVPCCTVEYSKVQYSIVQYSTVQYSTVQYSTVQYSTVKCTIQGNDQPLPCLLGYYQPYLVRPTFCHYKGSRLEVVDYSLYNSEQNIYQ